jgi:O-acetyl-ADP-ribose deacetylase (regulator of RNase III)
MLVKVVLVDINPKMVKAWRDTFEENPEVEILQGSILECQTSAWVSPTNAAGRMDGGLDLVIKNHLGPAIEGAVQKQIASRYNGKMPVGHSTCVPTGRTVPRYVISTPTMMSSSEDISDTLNVALACAAALQAVHTQNEAEPGSIRSVALPGLGANTGRVPVEICADLMWTAYSLFRQRSFASYQEMRAALEAELGDLGPVSTKKGQAAQAAPTNGHSKLHLVDEDDDDEDEDEDHDDKDFDDAE